MLFTVALNKLIASRDEIIESMVDDADVQFDTTTLETKRASLLNVMNVLSEKMQEAISENARVALDQTEYHKKYDVLADRYTAVKRKHDDIEACMATLYFWMVFAPGFMVMVFSPTV